MASISFEHSEDKLILCYDPAMGIGDIKKRLDANEVFSIKRTFFVTKDLLFEPEKNIGIIMLLPEKFLAQFIK